MPAFKFPLETVLKLRRHAEEDARKKLAEKIAALDRKEREMLDLRNQLTESVDTRKNALLDGVFLPQFQMVDMGWMQVLKNRMSVCHGQIQQAAAVVEQARAQLVEARRSVKALETLRERREKQWRQAENRRTENILSDMAGVNWLRQNREEAERRLAQEQRID
ncbi:MAG: Flagellar FliJ protein [Fibrobacterota bacterium]|jgi:flagellar export protein FliJ